MTLIDDIATWLNVGLSAKEIATIVNRPLKQVESAIRIIRAPEAEAERQAAYYAKRRSDNDFMERKREAARRSIARRGKRS